MISHLSKDRKTIISYSVVPLKTKTKRGIKMNSGLGRIKTTIKKVRANKDAKIPKMQQCIELVTIPEFINRLPHGVHIKELLWEVIEMSPWQNLDIPPRIKMTGVEYARQSTSRTNVRGIFRDMSNENIIASLSKISKFYGISTSKFRIHRIMITDGKSYLNFIRAKKEVQLARDRRMKVRVLGMHQQNGKILTDLSPHNPAYSLLEKMNHFKALCEVKTVIRRIVSCKLTTNPDKLSIN